MESYYQRNKERLRPLAAAREREKYRANPERHRKIARERLAKLSVGQRKERSEKNRIRNERRKNQFYSIQKELAELRHKLSKCEGNFQCV